MNTLHTMQGATGRTLSSRTLRAPALALALAALLALLLTLGLGQMQTAQAQGPAILYVDAGATGANDGSSWQDAYTKLQDALDVANADSGTVYEIWAAAGVYYPDEGGSHVDNSPSESFRLNHDNVRLYGGFAGGESAREQRDWAANPTVLSGDIGQDDMTDAHGVVTSTASIAGTNAFHVLYLDGAGSTPVTANTAIDGFTVTGGSAIAFSEPPHDSGGGLYCAGGSGGECSPTLTNLVFSGNQAGYGGGMANDGSGGVSSPSLSNVTFDGNQAEAYGGGMYNYGYGSGGVSSPTLNGVTFSGNQADLGGGMINRGDNGVSSPTLTNVAFSGNSAVAGGGMVNDGENGGVSSPALSGVTFSGNRAVAYGGGMFNLGSDGGSECSPTLIDVAFSDNSANEGGGMYNLGQNDGVSSPTLTNVLFSGNYAGNGGGAMFNLTFSGECSPALSNVTFSGNQAVNSGGAMFNQSVGGVSSPVIVNTILWGNRAPTDGPQISNVNAMPTLSYSLVQGGCPTGAACGAGMLDADPLFVAPIAAGSAPTTTGDYRLQFASPAIDAGNTFSVTVDTDLDGNRRVVNHIVDMGAYEAQTAFTLHIGTAGQGAVTVDPQQDEHLYGTAVTLTAQPAAGWALAGWSGDLDGTANPATLVITENKTITATFTPLTYSLHIGTAGQGAVTVDPQRDVYAYGTAVTLTAQADTGWTLAGWSGILFAQAANLVPNPITLTIAENTSVTATFEALTYTLSLAADPPQGGTVSGAGVYTHGAQAEANAMPAPGWLFVEWRENAARVSGDALYRFSVTGDRALTAHFRETTGEETGQQPAPHRVLLPAVIGGAP